MRVMERVAKELYTFLIHLTCPSTQHDNTATLEFIHHPPKVRDSALQWTLCSYVGTFLLVTLYAYMLGLDMQHMSLQSLYTIHSTTMSYTCLHMRQASNPLTVAVSCLLELSLVRDALSMYTIVYGLTLMKDALM